MPKHWPNRTKILPSTYSKKVYVGVSGGVDSSVALALLKDEGYEVTGVFLKTWYPEWMQCDWKEERRSAMRVCATLGVPFMTLDCEKEYKKEVVDYMLREYGAGRVPNPDVFCNKYIKFGVFLRKMRALGADYIATGHYARICTNMRMDTNDTNGYELLEGMDKEKDQSYFLYTLNQDQLSHVLFPVGNMRKSDVRKLAEKFGLPTAHKKDSQGLCFIGKVDMKEFLSHYIETKSGDVLNTSGEVIGRHDGALLYAIGERHSFEITKKTPETPRLFVISKDVKKNTITVASKEYENVKVLSVKEVIIKDLHFINTRDISGILHKPLRCSVRIRYRQEKQDCILHTHPGSRASLTTGLRFWLAFSTPQSGVSIGQSAVLYSGDICLGGGVIEEVQ